MCSNANGVSSPLPLPALHASHSGTWLTRPNAGTEAVSKGDAIMAAADTPLLLLNAPLVANRLGYPDLSGLDLLELYAFVHPARFCVPTPRGLAEALGLDEPSSDSDVPAFLQEAAGALVAMCEEDTWSEREGAWSALQSLVKPALALGASLGAAYRATPTGGEMAVLSPAGMGGRRPSALPRTKSNSHRMLCWQGSMS